MCVIFFIYVVLICFIPCGIIYLDDAFDIWFISSILGEKNEKTFFYRYFSFVTVILMNNNDNKSNENNNKNI